MRDASKNRDAKLLKVSRSRRTLVCVAAEMTMEVVSEGAYFVVI